MSSSKTLLLATAVATILSLPAFASDAPPASFDGTAGTNAVKAAPGEPLADGAAPTTMDPTSSPPTAIAAPTPGTPAADAPPADVTAPSPATATVPPTMSADPVAPMDAAAPASEDDMAAPDVAPTTTTPAPTDAAAPTMPPDEPTPSTDTATPVTTTPAETNAAPASEPEPKKVVTKPAKLSALAKKYDLLALDTNGDKTLSKSEFTANGNANAKLFARYDFDHNGKLTNAEMNAYAAKIEADLKK